MSKLIIEARCSAERVLTVAMECGADISNLRVEDEKVRFYAAAADEKNLLPALFKYACSAKIIGKTGFAAFKDAFMRHIGIAAGAVIAVAVILILNAFCLRVVIDSDGAYSERISAVLAENGVGKGVAKSKVDCEYLERVIAENITETAFVSVKFSGGNLKVSVKSELSVAEGEGLKENIYSEYNAVITRIIPRSGTVTVKTGQAVKAGDLLVSGEYVISEEGAEEVKKVFVGAGAKIYGRVWNTKKLVLGEQIKVSVRTGNVKSVSEFTFGRLKTRAKSPPYDNYQMEKISVKSTSILPFVRTEYTYYELADVMVDRSAYIEWVMSQMLAESQAALGDTGRIIRSWTQITPVGEEAVVDLYIEMEKRIDKS